MKIIFTKLFNKTLKKQLAFCIVLLISVNALAQVTATEDFENETTVVNASPHTFSESGISFSTTLKYQKNNGFFGYAASTSYIFFFNSTNGVGQSETMTISNPSTSFRINSFAAYIGNGASESGGAAANGTITFVGTLASGGTATATVNVASTGSVPSGQTREVNGMVNGLSFADTPLDGAFITSLSVQSSATVQFIQLDHINFTTQAVVSNQFSISDVTQNEGNSSTSNFTFTVTRSNATAASSVQVQSSNVTATSGSDYTAFPLTTVNFTAGGALTQTVNVVVNGDVSVEPNETFTMTLSNPSGGILLDAIGTGTILDDDAINEPFDDETDLTSSFSQSGNNFQTTGKLVVRRNGGNFGAGGTQGYAASSEPYAIGNQGSLQMTTAGKSFNVISVDLWAAAVSGSAPNWTFTPTNGTITFTGTRADGLGTVTHTASITPSGTNVHSTVLFATSPFNGVQLSAISFSTPTGIQYLQVDNFKYGTAPLTNTQLSIDDVSVVEGTGGGSTTATFTVTRTNNTTAFTVNLASADGTATAGTDYTAYPSTTLTFTSGGALTQTVNVTVLKDATIEPNETFNMTLSGATNGTVYLKQTGIGTILNDDSVVETFEDETNNALTFSQNSVNFSTSGGFKVKQASSFGSGSSTFYLTSSNNAVGNQGTFSITSPNKAFKMNFLDAWVGVTSASNSGSGSVTFTGTLFGGGTVSATKTITTTANGGTGWQQNISFAGTDLENVLLTAIQVSTAGTIAVCDIDNFNYTIVNTLPIIEVVDASNNAITNGGAAATANNTDFGGACVTGGTVSKTYTIKNSGLSNLTLSGSPLAVLGGTDASHFSITTQPTSPIAAAGSVTFTVQFDPSSAGAKNATITLTNNDATNSPYIINITGTGNANPTATITPTPNPVCQNRTLNLSAPAGATTYLWSGNGIVLANSNTTTAVPTSTGVLTYSLTMTNSAGCTATATTSVTVNAAPSATITPTPTAVCVNGTINLSALAGATTYLWSGNGIVLANSNTTTAVPTASGTQIYSLTATDAAGCSASSTASVTVNALPIPNASSDSPKCVGTTLNFNSETGMSSYAWTGPNSFSSSIQNPNITDVTTDAAGIYSLTVTDANSCTSSETLVVTINPLPTPNASSDSPKCVGSTLSFNSETGMSSYAWTGPNSFSSSIQNPSITDVNTDAAGIYSLTVTDANGCTSSETLVVTINPLPIPNASSDSPKCVGAILSFNSEAGLTSYDWTGPNSFSSSIQNPSITDVTTDAAGIYSLTVTDANGCTSSETVVVTINSLPVPNASSDSPKCVGATLSFNSEAGLTTYDWTGPNSFSSSIQNPNITDVTTDASGIYSLTVTDANGCTSSETLVVTINPLPIPNSSSDSPKCVGSTLSFNSETGMSSYAWTGPNSFSSSIQNPSITDVTTDAAGIYSLTVTDANGCTSSETISVIINTLPTPNASSDSPKCVGTTLSFNSQTSMSSYAWTGPNSFSSSIQNPSIADVTSDAAGIYSLTVTDANGCTSSENIAVTINSLPSANPSSDSPKCVGTALSFNSEVGLSSYDWTGPNSFSSSIQNPSITNVTTDAGGTYSLTVTDSNGCTTTAEIVVVVNDIPNTPITATQNVCYGSNLTLGASCASGSHTIWATDTPGVYVNSLTVNNVTTDMTYQVACERDDMTGCFSTFVSSFVKVNTTISYTPISSEDSYVYTCQNGIGWIILNNSVVGNPLNIQWQLDTGTGFANVMSSPTYEGITNDSLKINNVSTTMNGYRYRAVVSNECNTIITDTSTLRVNQLPIIDIQPLGQTVCVGNQTTLSVVANGSGLSYQWQLNSGSGFVNIATNASYTGVNSPNLQITNIQSGFNGYQYRFVIFNECQSVNSDPAAIIVDPTVTILSQPFDKSICQNASTSFNILAVNTLGGTISYQWQRKSGTVWVNLSNGGVYAGVNTSAFSINGAPANLSGSIYRCVINGYCQSQSVTLSVIPIATISLQPSNVNICVGNNTSFSVNALGINLAYRWQVNTGTGFVNILDGGIYQGATTQSLLLDQPKSSLNGFLYRCIVTGNGSCDVIPAVSNSAILNIGTSAEAQTIVAVSPINSGSVVYQAVQVVLGLNSIVSPARVEYRAGNSILLNPGFEVNTGAVFTAKIQNPCSNPTNFQVNSNNLPKEIKK